MFDKLSRRMARRDKVRDKMRSAHPEPVVCRHIRSRKLVMVVVGDLETSSWQQGGQMYAWEALCQEPRRIEKSDAQKVAAAWDGVMAARRIHEKALKAAHDRGAPVSLEEGMTINAERAAMEGKRE